ncbi:MAG: hypothetical protein GY869_13490 [Planctomycetes bacterium]|nr:hypothetical protein [Planctomycetota bacterium]
MAVVDQGYVRMGKCDMGLHPTARIEVDVAGASSFWECAAGGETSLIIGMEGRAEVDVSGNGRLLSRGHLTLAEEPGSWGMLTMDEGWVEVLQTMIVGGGMDGPGGMAVVDVAQNSLLSVGDGVGDKLIVRCGGMVIVDHSTLDLDFGGSVGEVVLDGVLGGGGIIQGDVLNEGGTVKPGIGSSKQTLEVHGDYSQSLGGAMEFEIGGAQEGSDYGRLMIGIEGAAELDGMLKVSLVNGFVPAGVDEFLIVEAPGGISGRFANAESIYIFYDGTFDVEYTGTEVWLKNFRSSPACLTRVRGDMNGDCRVNLIDLAILGGAWLESGII